jgi:hypothetical protein
MTPFNQQNTHSEKTQEHKTIGAVIWYWFSAITQICDRFMSRNAVVHIDVTPKDLRTVMGSRSIL